MKIGFQAMLDAANKRIETVTATDALALHDSAAVLFVDLRDVRELEREGMIPGAFHCPRGMLEFWVHPDSPYHKPALADGRKLLLYCASGWRSALSAVTLEDIGVPAVAHLGGGFSAWRKAGGAVVEKARS